jgi:hypothetical protein
MTYQEATDIMISKPRTPLTTGEADSTSERISSFSSVVPTCSRVWIIERPPLGIGSGLRVQ